VLQCDGVLDIDTGVRPEIAVCCRELQHVAVCCSVLQYVLQCVDVLDIDTGVGPERA